MPGQPRLPADIDLLREKDRAGFSQCMLEKSNDGRGHAARMAACLVDGDEPVQLPTIAAPKRSWPSVQQLYDRAFEMEKQITASMEQGGGGDQPSPISARAPGSPKIASGGSSASTCPRCITSTRSAISWTK